MTEEEQKRVVRSRVKKKKNLWPYFLIILLIGSGVAYYIYQQSVPTTETTDNNTTNVAKPERYSHELGHVDSMTTKYTPEGVNVSGKPYSEKELSNSTSNLTVRSNQVSQSHSGKGSVEQSTGSVNTSEYESPVTPFITDLNTFYSHLDKQPYMKEFGLKEPSKVHFSKLLQKLIDSPPTVARETDDLFTLLKNTAHFFRVLGKDNIIILKGILDREKASVETTLNAFYSLIEFPDELLKEYQLSMPFESLYDYAGFFLNTMGGRLYLFRRDSTSRMVVSYYAIMIVEKANSDGNSRHGIDIAPAVDFLIEEMETGGKKLKMKEAYLDTLYDLKEKYN